MAVTTTWFVIVHVMYDVPIDRVIYGLVPAVGVSGVCIGGFLTSLKGFHRRYYCLVVGLMSYLGGFFYYVGFDYGVEVTGLPSLLILGAVFFSFGVHNLFKRYYYLVGRGGMTDKEANERVRTAKKKLMVDEKELEAANNPCYKWKMCYRWFCKKKVTAPSIFRLKISERIRDSEDTAAERTQFELKDRSDSDGADSSSDGSDSDEREPTAIELQ